MLPLYQDHWYTFRFAEDRLIPRFHLEGVLITRSADRSFVDGEGAMGYAVGMK
jgi:hypothetical protein